MKPSTSPVRSASHLFVALLLGALPVAAAFGQQAVDPAKAAQMQAAFQKRFAAADANGDGKLTKQEADGKMPFVYKHFDEIDTTHQGFVTKDQIAAYIAKVHEARATDNK
jgi:hypothetical protein